MSFLSYDPIFATLAILASGYLVYDAPIWRFSGPKYTGYVLYFRILTFGWGYCLFALYF